MTYLSDVIGKEYKNWEKGFVFLKAGTGCGKTTFVLTVLTQHAIKNGKSILYLVNRTILKQQLMSLLENPHLQAYHAELEENFQKYCNDEYDFETFRSMDSSINNYYLSHTDYETHFPFLNLTLRTYQNFEEMILEGKTEHYDYIVCDEAHYFMNDSLFSSKTFVSYDYVMKKGMNKESTVILMSATAWYLEKLLIDKGFLEEQNIFHMSTDYAHVENVQIYIKLQLDSIINDILIQYPNSRILFFTNRNSIYKYFYEKHNDISCFMAATNSKVYEKYSDIMTSAELVEYDAGKWTFNRDKRICITTSVIDNGVSIKDDSINFIFCDFEDIVQSIQAIGRKRALPNDKCIIYLQNHINYSRTEKYIDNCHVASLLYENKYAEFNNFIIQNEYFGAPLRLFEDYPILYLSFCDLEFGASKFSVKRPVYHQFQWLIQQNEEIKEMGYIDFLKQYIPELADKLHIKFFDKRAIEAVLESYPDNIITKDQRDEFLNKLHSIDASFDKRRISSINTWLRNHNIKYLLTSDRSAGHRESVYWVIHNEE